MASIFITGSTEGLGRAAAQALIEQGHRVVLHARSERPGGLSIHLSTFDKDHSVRLSCHPLGYFTLRHISPYRIGIPL